MPADDRTNPDNWGGGYYELAILLGPADDGRVEAAAQALWTAPGVDGPELLGGPPAPPPARHTAALREGRQVGTATLPDGRRVVCGLLWMREDDTGLDWVDFFVPLGSLSKVEPRVGAFPFGGSDDCTLQWRHELDAWLVGLGERVHRVAPFERAYIGFEVLGEDLAADDAADRWWGTLQSVDGRLGYLPPTQG